MKTRNYFELHDNELSTRDVTKAVIIRHSGVGWRDGEKRHTTVIE